MMKNLSFKTKKLINYKNNKLHIKTPLIENTVLSKHIGANVLLKLDSFQPSGSFKIRGIGHMCKESLKNNKNIKKFICSSGGNAGYAVA
jgi:L-serine/L-threonine ammonia-lyase